MSKMKFFFSLFLAVSILLIQVGGVFAAPALQTFPTITGIIQSIALETDSNTGIATVVVCVVTEDKSEQTTKDVRVSQKSAEKLGLVVPDADGNPVINESALGHPIEINLNMIVPKQAEERHPVGNALETFFSDIDGLNYGLIMDKHGEGLGFAVIAQALWLTRQMGGDAKDFQNVLLAKQTGDYSKFSEYLLEDGTSPTNWGQLKKALLQPNKKDTSTNVVSNQNDNGDNKEKNKDKDKGKEKDNKGNDKGK